jgi:hypothetical protein
MARPPDMPAAIVGRYRCLLWSAYITGEAKTAVPRLQMRYHYRSEVGGAASAGYDCQHTPRHSPDTELRGTKDGVNGCEV